MLSGVGRNKGFILLLIPLLFSSLSTFLVYSGHFSNYYANYENLFQTTFPDYALITENDLLILKPDFNSESFLRRFDLDEVTYVGKLSCNVSIDSNNYEIALYWAPEEFFIKHSDVRIEKGRIIFDESFIPLIGSEIDQNISLTFTSKTNMVHANLSFCDFASLNDVFTSKLLRFGWVEDFQELNLFLSSETLFEIFNDFLNDITVYYAPLFEFSDDFLYSHPPHKMTEFLSQKRKELDSFFEYSYNSSNLEDEMFREYSLEREIQILNTSYNLLNLDILTRIIFFYIISFSFSYIILNNTVKMFFKSQKESIIISYLRGSRRENLLRDFITLELKITLSSIIFGFSSSIIVVGVFTPSLLKFIHYYMMNILIISLLAIFYGCIQLIILSNYLIKIYQSDEEDKRTPINQLSKFLGKILPWILLNILLGFSFFMLFFTGFSKFEFESMNLLIIITVLFILLLNIMMHKRTIAWIGKKIISLSHIFSHLSKQTIKQLRRFLKDSHRVAQLLILLIMTSTFFLTSSDTIKNFSSLNYEYNQVGDVIISIEPEKSSKINTYLNNIVDNSVEIQSLTTLIGSISIEQSSGISRLVNIFFINSSKIELFFNSTLVNEKYKGSINVHEIENDLVTDLNTAIVNNALAQLLSIQIQSSFNLPTIDHKLTALDLLDFIPFFSGISLERPFAILNDKMISDTSNVAIQRIYQILWLKETVSREAFGKNIQTLNENNNTQIEIIEQFDYPIITDDYWDASVFRKFMFALLIVFIVCLFFLFLAFYSDSIENQMKGFRIFFARGLSFKRGIFLAMIPLFLFTLFYILFSYVIGIILTYVMFAAIQPKFYLRIPLTLLPSSFSFFSAQILLLGSVLIVAGIRSYKKLRKQIPEIRSNIPSVFLEKEERI